MAGRPKNTQSIIDAIKRQGQLKIHGVKKIEILAKQLWDAALGKDGEPGDLRAIQFITTMVDGKPVERREVTHSIFQHYPQLEENVDMKKYDDAIEIKAEIN